VSWDVHLLKFQGGAEANFDLGAAEAVLRGASGFLGAEPGVGELGSSDIYYGPEPSSDVMVAVRAASPAVFQLIYDLAVELRMVVFFPTEASWGVAVVERSQVDDFPDASWDGWERFDDGFTPPAPIVCQSADDLGAALAPAYNGWETWSRGRG
jgi:hypothetical protein